MNFRKLALPLFTIVLLVVPFFVKLANVKAPVALFEQRQMASFPGWENWEGTKSYLADIDTYLDDNYGLRDLYVYTNFLIRAKVFNLPSSSRGRVGTDGWRFLLEDSALTYAEYCGLKTPSSYRLAEIVNAWERAHWAFARKNIDIKYAIIPRKEEVYFEQLPKHLQSDCKPEAGLVSEVLARLSPDTRKDVLYLKDNFIDAKQTHQLYGKLAFHWHGSSYATYLTAERVLSAFGQSRPNWDLIEVEDKLLSDTMQWFVGMPITEQLVVQKRNSPAAELCVPLNCYEGLSDVHPTGGDSTYAPPSGEAGNDRLLMVTDSFGKFVTQKFVDAFDGVLQVSMNALSGSEYQEVHDFLMQDFKPTHVLVLFNSSNIKYFDEKYAIISADDKDAAIPDELLTERRISDLEMLAAALESYLDANDAYPRTDDLWIGNIWWKEGLNTRDQWIPGLTTDYIAYLPTDPVPVSGTDSPQYIYRSDGTGYKLLAYHPQECPEGDMGRVKNDPIRNKNGNCNAFGIWTENHSQF